MKHIFTLFILISVCICKVNNSTAQVNVNDSLALVDLYNSTDGAHWTNHSGWLQGPVISWYGVSLSNGRVFALYLDYNNLKGTMPSSLGNISAMYSFQMGGNQLTGTLPSSIGKLTNLNGFSLYDNQLTGTLPASFSNLKQLTTIFMWNNQLTGSLSVLENCANPVDFELSYNQFTGSLPNLQHIENMFELNLDHNQFTGEIPYSYSYFKVQSQITLDNNQLSGVVPTSLTNLDLYAIFDIHNNHFNFDSLEYIISNSQHYYFNYAPQLNIPITYTPQGAYGKLSVHAGGTLNNNTYLWYRNNSLYKTIVGDSAFIADAPGVYFVKVNNAVVTALQLTSDSITIAAACSVPPSNTTTTSIKQTTAKLNWNAAQGAVKYQIKFGPTGGAVSTINTANPYYKLSGLTANTNYTWKVRSKCSLQYSAYSAVTSFTTLPAFAATSQSEDEINKENSFAISPNPASANINVLFNSSKQSAYSITFYDIAGKMLLSKTGSANAGINNFMLDVHALSAGTYFIKIYYDTDKTIMQKLVKQ